MHRRPHSHHSPEFKEQALLKARHRGTRSILSLASELNMSAGTLKRWVLDSGKTGEQATGQTSLALDGPAAAWSPSQRLAVLQESYALNGSALAGWCREHGVFEHQLVQWREEFCTPVAPASREATGAFRELQRQHEHLQRELRRQGKGVGRGSRLAGVAKKFPGAAGGRGQMTSVQQRQKLLLLIDKACADGARLEPACRQIGLCARSVQRWQRTGAAEGDQRKSDKRRYVCPPNKLREEERQAVMATLNSEAFKDLPPSQIVPRLADTGLYVASESTMYRLLQQDGQLTHRRLERAAQKRGRPRALAATGPDQVFCWDITYLPTQVRGQHFYLYLFEDLFSRNIVGWQVFDCESAELASRLLRDICERQNIRPGQLTVHSDNGAPMKGETMLATMQHLGVAHTRSRPSVSNDNPYVESAFRTLKYRPQLPVKPFENLLAARRWVTELGPLVQPSASP